MLPISLRKLFIRGRYRLAPTMFGSKATGSGMAAAITGIMATGAGRGVVIAGRPVTGTIQTGAITGIAVTGNRDIGQEEGKKNFNVSIK